MPQRTPDEARGRSAGREQRQRADACLWAVCGRLASERAAALSSPASVMGFAMSVDGVFSVFASATSGTAIGTIEIRNGHITGNDFAGAQYSGTAVPLPDGSVKMSITMEMPDGLFHIWSGMVSDIFQSRTIDIHLPRASPSRTASPTRFPAMP